MTARTEATVAALRLYFPSGARAQATRLWHRLSAPALARHLLQAARQARIAQAMLHPISAGYLPGGRLSHSHPELTDMRHPQCLELLDTEQRLRDFLHEHAPELHKVHAVLFLCELPLGHPRGAPAPEARP